MNAPTSALRGTEIIVPWGRNSLHVTLLLLMQFVLMSGQLFAQDPNLPPSGNFELIDWKITLPDQTEVKEQALSSGFESPNEFYTDPNTGAMVFRCPNNGATGGSTYPRSELREMLRRGNTSISTTGIGLNNWVFSTSSQSNQDASGGVDGTLTATVAVDHVSTTGNSSMIGRVIIGQIHAGSDEPCRLYYRKLPGNTKGSIYIAHEPGNGNAEQWYDMIGSRSSSASDPADGIALGEQFSYEIDVVGNTLTVTIIRPGKPDVVEIVDMSNSGFANDWMYFKAGCYNQNNSGNSGDYAQVSFFALSNTHSSTNNSAPSTSITAPSNGASFTTGDNITINADASDSDGSISKVEFFQGSTKLGEDTSSPYSYTWNNVLAGNYNLTSVATDDQGATGTSSAVSVSVSSAPPSGSNLALNKPVTVSSEQASNPGPNLVDDDPDSRWSASGYPQWAEVDLGGTYSLSNTEVICFSDRAYQYIIEASSNGTSYNLIVDRSGNTTPGTNTSPITDNFSPVDARYVRITVSGASGYTGSWVSLEELRVFGEEGGGNPNVNPTTSITSPVNGTGFTEGDNITINADAADSDGSISKVEFFQGVTKLGEDLTSPYSYAWTNVSGGSYDLTTVATDDQGGTGTSAVVSITVNSVPTTSITSPTDGATFDEGANVTITADASDSDGSISVVEFFQGATKLGEDLSSPYSFTWNNVAAGSYGLTSVAIDNSGASTTSAIVNITVNAPPVQYTLTTNTSGLGTVSANPTGGSYDDGTVVSLTATPDAGYQFDGWSGDATGTQNPINVTMDANKTVTATFSQTGTTYNAPYDIPRFQGFIGECKLQAPTSSTAATQSDLINGYTSSWFYVADGDKVAFNQSGASQRTELRDLTNWTLSEGDRSLHARINIVQQTCDQVTVMQIHDDANVGSGPNKPLVRIYKHQTKSPVNHLWAAYKTDAGGANTTHIDLGLAPSGYFTCDIELVGGNMIVKVDGVEKANVDVSFWTFPSYWKAGVYLQDAGEATAYFDELYEGTPNPPTTYTLTTNAAGNGSISLNPAGGTYNEGTVVSMTATPDANHQFDNWSGGANGSQNPINVTMNSNLSVTANFSPIAVTGVDVTPSSVTLVPSGTQQLSANISPSNAANQNVTWSTSDPAIATVNSSGLVTAVSDGAATITATTVDGGFTDISTITVDSGGSGSTWTQVSFEDFESGWGIWNDGGSDARRYTGGTHAHQGSASMAIQDNTSSSVVTTDNISLSGNNDLKIDFWFKPVSMENGEDFWLQISTNGGSSYTTVQSWVISNGSSYENNNFYQESVELIGYSLNDQTRVRLRCDASGNGDDVYIDEVEISTRVGTPPPPSSWNTISDEDFESGWGIWNDGGSDASLYTGGTHAHQGSAALNIENNSSSSVVTTNNLSLASYADLKVDFWFKPVGMDNGHDFWLQVSTDGGSNYTTVQSYVIDGSNYSNDNFYQESFELLGYGLNDQTRVRFRCDANDDGNDIYLDEIVISAKGSSSARTSTEVTQANGEQNLEEDSFDKELKVYPNPVRDMLTLEYYLEESAPVVINVYDVTGKIVANVMNEIQAPGIHQPTWNISNTNGSLKAGFYLLRLSIGGESISKRIIIFR